MSKRKNIEPLKNCAFCGGAPKLIRCGDQKEFVTYICSKCFETPVRLDEASICEFSARRRWNQRTDEAEYVIRCYNHVQDEFANSLSTSTYESKLTYELLEIATELDAREATNNCIIRKLQGVGWKDLCRKGIDILNRLNGNSSS